ncbi:hypothetical protein CesoFtcFv8_015904 [Champsocephalus esox]|uniref:Uncharacterized protein n=2 Tax=Champsocephalus TaxID=52236 RepID=A0AAN8DCA1_CHAGU|nr:hypothetical protein CesoFtcFv8_015904 [Champsocephalus esox]KAK5917760.1 hypothetical protein CgunFtcFv8_002577 [Champsocephalus gunnari]
MDVTAETFNLHGRGLLQLKVKLGACSFLRVVLISLRVIVKEVETLAFVCLLQRALLKYSEAFKRKKMIVLGNDWSKVGES